MMLKLKMIFKRGKGMDMIEELKKTKKLSLSAYKKIPYMSLLSFIVIILIWCILTYGGILDKVFLPTPTAVVMAAVNMYQAGTLIPDMLDSVVRIIIGWAIAALIALPLGMLIAKSRSGSSLIQPLIEFARYLPITALVPLTLLYCGIGELQKYTVIFLGTFFQLVLMISDSVSAVDKNLLNASRTLGAGTWQTYRLVLFPAALPGILDSFRLTIGWAWTYLVVAEMIAANSGLGYLIIKSQRFLKTDNIFAGLILIGIIGLVTDFLFRLIAKIITPWYERLSDH